MKDDYTHLTIVVDRSGSMSSIREDAQGGLNNLIKEQAAEEGSITVSLYQFDTTYEKVFGPIDAKEAPTYNLQPRGMTALLDATGRAITETGAFLRGLSEAERPSKVVFCIVTDGAENASREFSRERIKEMITEQTDKWSWQFVYLGANLDAVAESRSMGIQTGIQYVATAASAGSSYGAMSSSLKSYRSKGVSGQSINSFAPDAILADGTVQWKDGVDDDEDEDKT